MGGLLLLQNLPKIIENARQVWTNLENICRLAGFPESLAYWLAAAMFGTPFTVTVASFFTRITSDRAGSLPVFFIKKFFEFLAMNSAPVKMESMGAGPEKSNNEGSK